MTSRPRSALAVVVATIVVALASPAAAAVITIVNQDGSNEGFNDPTPVAPVGGNNATTPGSSV